MLFLVPDSPDDTPSSPSGEAPSDASVPGGGGADSTSSPDAGDAGTAENGEAKATAVKVELDLDDAPFLEEEEPEPKKEETPKENLEQEKQDTEKEDVPKKKFFSGKKKLLLGGVLLVLLLAGGGAAYMLLSSKEEPAPKPPEDKTRVIVLNSTQPVNGTSTAPFASVVVLDPFVVPRKGSEGEVRFLHCTLALPLTENIQGQEINARKLVIRDAIYYYLINRPLMMLKTEQETNALKEELVRVVNEHMSTVKLKDVYIQEYVVTGQ